MASFTDKNLQPFNPYVSQLPVDDMVKVGMEKQKLYNEGVEKIQNNIDRVAGIDIARGVDKNYLQSKLNALTTNVRMVAGGDFSNSQLVNSVNGMTSALYQDENIQNAVSSTAMYKKQYKLMEKAIENGESSIANQFDFNNNASKYLESVDINDKFNSRYQQYIDVDKKWIDVYKSLHSDLKEVDIPYVMNDDGSLNYNKTASAMKRISKESVSAEKIENALRSSLSPDELNQLNINGRYQFKDYDTPEKLAVYASKKYEKYIDNNNATIAQLNGVVAMSASNPKRREQALKTIENLTLNNKTLQENYESEAKFIIENPEEAKGLIYKNEAISQFANSHSWEATKENLLTNPILEAQHWEIKDAREQSALNLRAAEFSWSKSVDSFNMNMKDKEYALKVNELQTTMFGNRSTFTNFMGENTKIEAPLQAAKNYLMELEQAEKQSFLNLSKAFPDVTSTQIKNAINAYNSGDSTRIAEANLHIPPKMRSSVNTILERRKEARITQAAINNSYEGLDMTNKEIGSTKGLSVNVEGGRMVFGPAEVAAFFEKIEDNHVFTGASASKPKFKTALNSREKIMQKLYAFGNNKEKFSQIYRSVSTSYRNKKEENEKIANAKFNELSGKFLPRISTITFGSEDGNIARQTYLGIFSSLLMGYQEKFAKQAGGTDKITQDEVLEGLSWTTGTQKNDLLFKQLVQGNKTYLIVVNGNKELTIPMNSDEAASIPFKDPNAPSAAYTKVVEAQFAQKGSTNSSGLYQNSYFTQNDFPNTSLRVRADFDWDLEDKTKQFITFKLPLPNGIAELPIDDSVDRQTAMNLMRGITDNELKLLYLSSSKVDEKYKNEIKKLK
jgi:uncharacterized protein (DUF433 family)